MRIANVAGRLTLMTDDTHGIDVETASKGKFEAEPHAIFARWPAFIEWARSARTDGAAAVDARALASPSPHPTQVFGIGLNYRAHATEAGLPLPDSPATFTKFPTCICAPHADVPLPSAMVDWEVELVVVIGVRAYRVDEAHSWDTVAGLAVGQDVSERAIQWKAGMQFSLGKSFPFFGPVGPWIVTIDELENPDDLDIRCSLNDEVVQHSRTSDMVFSVPRLIAELSAILPLLPGDLIFTGTPAGIGAARKPPRFLQAGDVLTSTIEGIGTLRNRCVAGD